MFILELDKDPINNKQAQYGEKWLDHVRRTKGNPK
jgi:hypothetical protein